MQSIASVGMVYANHAKEQSVSNSQPRIKAETCTVSVVPGCNWTCGDVALVHQGYGGYPITQLAIRRMPWVLPEVDSALLLHCYPCPLCRLNRTCCSLNQVLFGTDGYVAPNGALSKNMRTNALTDSEYTALYSLRQLYYTVSITNFYFRPSI